MKLKVLTTWQGVGALMVAAGLFPYRVPLAHANGNPSSFGAAATVDAAMVRVPLTRNPPAINGVMEEGEWEDATAFTGFWYDKSPVGGDFHFLAPRETQNNVYVMHDRESLYMAVTYPVFPEGTWLQSKGRFPNVLMHPRYGVLWDDHIEVELRPYHDIARGFQLGLFRWDVNSINTVCDWTWSLTGGGYDMSWQSGARIRSHVDDKLWVVEYAIPLERLKDLGYAGENEDGRPMVELPPPDGTVYRFWIKPGLGGAGLPMNNVFDQNVWNTTKGMFVFDSTAPAFQINDLGPIMDDIIDVRLSVKNHNTRSETMRIGFFVESAEGLIYSSYDAPELSSGLLELRPGETRQLRLRKALPGVTRDGNVLWFDVRSAGRPAKILFRARLMRFHAKDGGLLESSVPVIDPETGRPKEDPSTRSGLAETKQFIPYTELMPDMLTRRRAARTDFDAHMQVSHYDKRLFVVVDNDIAGGSDEARRAHEARVIVMSGDSEERVMAEATAPFREAWATLVLDVPAMAEGERYKASVLLFDEDLRIVGEKNLGAFTYQGGPWKNNPLGTDDVVWEGFAPIEAQGNVLDMKKHRFTVSLQGLPEQLVIKPDVRELPLEKRTAPAELSPAALLELGRGPQLREPMRLEAVIAGRRTAGEVIVPAAPVRTWKSEVEYRSELAFGALRVTLVTRYDCDGSLHARLEYGADEALEVDALDLVMPVDGVVDMALSDTGRSGGMAAADVRELTLSQQEGVVWDSTRSIRELTYGRFVPWFWFGSGDRGFTLFCDSAEGWLMDAEGSTLQLERDAAGKVTLRIRFVNHTADVQGRREIPFTLLTHPAKDRMPDHRAHSWHYTLGHGWANGYAADPHDMSDEELKRGWRQAAQAPADLPYEKAAGWRKDEPPFVRYGKHRSLNPNSHRVTPPTGTSPAFTSYDRMFEDKATYMYERQVRVGRRVGWHYDEYWPIGMGYSDNLAMGDGYQVPAGHITSNTPLPWVGGFLSRHQRNHYKRLARVHQVNNVPLRHQSWSNNEATMLESFWSSSFLVEECGAEHRAYEVDVVTQFPSSLYRYLSMTFSGLATAAMADATFAEYGDDKRLDRQIVGRALLNDIGVTPSGPHGILYHKEDVVGLLATLTDFGFFDDRNVEKLPYWRNAAQVAIGDRPGIESKVYVTVYRSPRKDGRGYRALFVVMNETFRPVELPLTLLDMQRILGGPNTLTAGQVRGQTAVPEHLGTWWAPALAREAGTLALMDVESGEAILAVPGASETYGPVYIPYHDFRVFLAEYDGGQPAN